MHIRDFPRMWYYDYILLSEKQITSQLMFNQCIRIIIMSLQT